MIIDTSAILAILRGEPGKDDVVAALARAATPAISAATLFETAIVVDANLDPVLNGRLDDLLRIARVEVEPVTERHAEIARQAYRDFGRGNGHPAALNMGDCFAYALSRASGRPLLYTGDNFLWTDVEAALPPQNPEDGPGLAGLSQEELGAEDI